MKTTQFISKWQSLLPEANRSEFALDVYKFLTSEKTANSSKKTLYTDTVEITVPTLIEVRRAFRALEENENSYIYKVFSDDHVFEAMAEIDKTHKDYFGEEAQPETAKPELNQIHQAYENGKKIRRKYWEKHEWIMKYDENNYIDEIGEIELKEDLYFETKPEDWEIYTEPEATPSSQHKFDRNRFEAMFRAVLVCESYPNPLKATEEILKQLDAYYASKEGGKHG